MLLLSIEAESSFSIQSIAKSVNLVFVMVYGNVVVSLIREEKDFPHPALPTPNVSDS
jgi:hypothetical protein